MSELPDVAGGQVISAAYTNQVKERTAMRYASAAARDSSLPVPEEGALAFLADVNVLTLYAGAFGWLTLVDNTGTVKAPGTIVAEVQFATGAAVPTDTQLAQIVIENPGIPGGCTVQLEGVGQAGFAGEVDAGVELTGADSLVYFRSYAPAAKWAAWTSFGTWTFATETAPAKLITINADGSASCYYTGKVKVWVTGAN